MEFDDKQVVRQIEKLAQQISDTEIAWGKTHVKLINKLQSLADLFFLVGRYADAEPLYRRLVDIKVLHLGERHPDTVLGIVDLADVFQAQHRNDEASKYYSCATRILIEAANELGGISPVLATAGMKLLECKVPLPISMPAKVAVASSK